MCLSHVIVDLHGVEGPRYAHAERDLDRLPMGHLMPTTSGVETML